MILEFILRTPPPPPNPILIIKACIISSIIFSAQEPARLRHAAAPQPFLFLSYGWCIQGFSGFGVLGFGEGIMKLDSYAWALQLRLRMFGGGIFRTPEDFSTSLPGEN